MIDIPIGKALVTIADFITAAMNEIWERDFWEPDEEGVYCSDCKHSFIDDDDVCRCKLKGDTISVDIYIKEPCSNYERINTEPARWIIIRDWGKEGLHCKCTNCNKIFYFWRGWEQVKTYQYCPHCGKPLLPPEENGE